MGQAGRESRWGIHHVTATWDQGGNRSGNKSGLERTCWDLRRFWSSRDRFIDAGLGGQVAKKEKIEIRPEVNRHEMLLGLALLTTAAGDRSPMCDLNGNWTSSRAPGPHAVHIEFFQEPGARTFTLRVIPLSQSSQSPPGLHSEACHRAAVAASPRLGLDVRRAVA